MTTGMMLRAAALAALATSVPVVAAAPNDPSGTETAATQKGSAMAEHPYVGIWVTADGHIRQALLPNGRYDEARGARRSAYQGRYEVRGARIEYRDDTGFTADGVFVTENVLHHGEMVFHRER